MYLCADVTMSVGCVSRQVEVQAVPVIKDTTQERKKPSSRADAHSSLVFGGHPPPKLQVPYQVTLRDKKDAYHAISMMKVQPLMTSRTSTVKPRLSGQKLTGI